MQNKKTLLFFTLITFFMFILTFGNNYSGMEILIGTAAIAILATFIFIELYINKTSPLESIGGAVGILIGLIAAGIIDKTVAPVFNLNNATYRILEIFILMSSTFLFYSIGSRLATTAVLPNITPKEEPARRLDETFMPKILDTSVIIDGRIADLCETGFLEGVFLVPQFILIELQHIADSSDSLKRARGRRGLDILDKLKKMRWVTITITEEDFPNIKEVDSKLVALGQKINGKVVTNDLNLNKISELQGVKVLNINELCNALKPIVLPGETMNVFVLKEGKEAGQGVAYLDDGTMIVVDDARRSIGKSVEVIVTSILQTTAGRMIFTKIKQTLTNSNDDVKVLRS